MLTKPALSGYNWQVQSRKSCEEESTRKEPFREPRLVERGTEEAAEHGLGAGMSIGRLPRVRPLKRFEANTRHCEPVRTLVWQSPGDL